MHLACRTSLWQINVVILKITTFALLCGSILLGSVAPNPFLKPGSNRKPPPPNKPVFKPKAIVRPDVAKELEFKGYFILKGQVYFSLFNKKVNHGEWIQISEKTYEDFSAHKFDLETETLTILYEGQSFELKLLQSKSSGGLPIPRSTNLVPPKSIPGLSKSSTPRVMPPKPKSNPVIPSFLVNKPPSGFPGSRGGLSTGSSTMSGGRSMLPGLPYPGFVPRRNTPANQNNPSQNQPSNTNSPISSIGSTISSNNDVGSNVSTNPSVTNNVNENINNSNNEIDLDSLPPPPPPPNILPPSPPPNLVPARED